MINFDDVMKEETKDHNPIWSQIPDHLHRLLIIGDYGFRKANSIFNLINQQPNVDKICLLAKHPFEAKYQFLINKREGIGLKLFNDLKGFIEYSYDMDGIYKAIEKHNPKKPVKY